MTRIAIIEDNADDLKQLEDCLRRYGQEQAVEFGIRSFSNPAGFLDSYRPDYDLIFMDIELPVMNGVDTARALRSVDPDVALVFITNMEQYAIRGYEVDAIDFVVKPINYYRFSSMLRKALRIIGRQAEKELVIQNAGNIARIRISRIFYIEIRDHLLLYHTEHGTVESWGKLSDLEAELGAHGFVRCSSAHLVNLRHVISVSGNTVNVAGETIPVSQRRRKAFYASLTGYLSEHNL